MTRQSLSVSIAGRLYEFAPEDVVDDTEALQWKQDLVEFVKTNPDVEGTRVLLTIYLDPTTSQPRRILRFPKGR